MPLCSLDQPAFRIYQDHRSCVQPMTDWHDDNPSLTMSLFLISLLFSSMNKGVSSLDEMAMSYCIAQYISSDSDLYDKEKAIPVDYTMTSSKITKIYYR